MTLINPASIERDRATQARVEINMNVVADYAAALREGVAVPPVVAFEDPDGRLWLADGWHRLHAHEAAGLEEMAADVRPGARRDAIFYAVGANATHGLRRTNADKRRAVEMLLNDPDWAVWSDRAIAEACRVGHPLVAAVRSDLTGSSSSGPQTNAGDRRVGRDGRAIDVSGLRAQRSTDEGEGQGEPRDDAGGAAPEEPAGVTGGPGEPVAPPSSAVHDDAREDRGVARETEGPSAALPSSAPQTATAAETEAGDRAAVVIAESPVVPSGSDDDEDAEVVVRRPGSTSQAATTARRASALAEEGEEQIRYLLADLRDVEWPDADLVVLDPPWSYVQTIGATRADNHYSCLPMDEIATLVERFCDRPGRVAVWCTWPTLAGWVARWPGFVSGGAWHKSSIEEDAGHYGPGFHWAGCSEPVLVYAGADCYTDRSVALRNAWGERPSSHSRKPVGWMVQWIRRWVPPGGLVCDPFGGLAAVAEATILAGEGRRYLGTEIDPQRHAEGLALLAEVRHG